MKDDVIAIYKIICLFLMAAVLLAGSTCYQLGLVNIALITDFIAKSFLALLIQANLGLLLPIVCGICAVGVVLALAFGIYKLHSKHSSFYPFATRYQQQSKPFKRDKSRQDESDIAYYYARADMYITWIKCNFFGINGSNEVFATLCAYNLMQVHRLIPKVESEEVKQDDDEVSKFWLQHERIQSVMLPTIAKYAHIDLGYLFTLERVGYSDISRQIL